MVDPALDDGVGIEQVPGAVEEVGLLVHGTGEDPGAVIRDSDIPYPAAGPVGPDLLSLAVKASHRVVPRAGKDPGAVL